MSESSLRLLVIGAHPDDAEYRAGGLAAMYRKLGHVVKFVSVTNGDAGHHTEETAALAARRREEASAAGRVCDIDYEVWNHHDGELVPSLEVRRQIIRLIRSFHPDLILTHRLNDYHPDHRATSQLVQDAAYMVTVPKICPDVAHLPRDPVIMYLADGFEKPTPFEPAVVIDIDSVFEQKLDMLHCHASQFYEWLPYNWGRAKEVPTDDGARRAFTASWVEASGPGPAKFQTLLEQTYGAEHAKRIRWIEAFEPCEYGCRFNSTIALKLFPFIPNAHRLS